jgi:hypothetical protein
MFPDGPTDPPRTEKVKTIYRPSFFESADIIKCANQQNSKNFNFDICDHEM